MKQKSRIGNRVLQIFSLVALLLVTGTATLAQDATGFGEPQAVVVPNSVQYDLKSAITGRDYRIFISAPADAGPDKAYPVLYMFDGNRGFTRAAGYTPAIVVGIGYPLDVVSVIGNRRQLDLTPTIGASSTVPSGDADNFLRMLEEEIRPFVEARYNLIADQQALYGYSLGGLAVLRHMFRNPEAFNSYIVVSPSIWWDNRVVLGDEAAFSARVRNEQMKLRVLLTSAGEEQNCDVAELSAQAKDYCLSDRMIDNASELAERLQAVNPETLQVTRVVFDDETHGSVPMAALGRALSFLNL